MTTTSPTPTPAHPTKAFGYVRVSGRAQVEGDGFARQTEEIKGYCAEAGVELVKVFEERGVSGTKGEEDRPAFMEMVEAILANGVRVIIVEGLDRLARETRIQESLILYLASKGITLISARTGANVTEDYSSDPMRKALIQIQGVFSELEKSLIVKKLKAARDRKREREGKCEGAKAFTESDKGKATVAKLIELRESGLTWQQVAEALNAAGLTTKSGKEWKLVNAQQVWRLYHGTMGGK